MRLQSPWSPRLADRKGPASERLIAALADDIVEGRLPSGARLPAQRDLAYRLGIGLGTVTKAYAVLDRRGLTRSVRGSGTFVAAVERRASPAIDLSVNTPPAMLSEGLLAKTLVEVSARIGDEFLTAYASPAGRDEHRRQMARWLAEVGMDAPAERLLLCNGAQQALALAFGAALRPGDTILTEAATYPGAIALARYAGYRLTGLALDEQGIVPDALERALASAGKKRRRVLLYVTPTMHNPTTATMRRRRRRDIARLCRRYDVGIVEDDVYALPAEAALPPLAMLAPERSFYVSSLSKTLSPGLRIGALVAPPGWTGRAEAALRATALTVSPLSCAVMSQWLTSGAAASVRSSIRAEARRRVALARSLLGGAVRDAGYDGFHVWLPMPWREAERLEAAAAAADVVLTPPQATAVDRRAIEGGLRLCLGRPPFSDLTAALGRIADALRALDGRARRSTPAV